MPELPRTTKAAILVEQHQPLVVAEVELPETLGVGQVLVKIHYSGICGSQLGEIDGVKGEDRYLPHLLGHEGSGTVLAVGPGFATLHLMTPWSSTGAGDLGSNTRPRRTSGVIVTSVRDV